MDITKDRRLRDIDKLFSEWISNQNELYLRQKLTNAIRSYEKDYNVTLFVQIKEVKNA